MSVLEDLQQLEQRIVKRAAELRGAVDEFDQLRQAASRLGIDLDKVNATPARRTATGRPKRSRATKARRTTQPRAKAKPGSSRGRGSRRDDVLRLVERRPGITVAELGKQLGVNATGLYRVVRELEGDGKVTKDGRTLTPTGR